MWGEGGRGEGRSVGVGEGMGVISFAAHKRILLATSARRPQPTVTILVMGPNSGCIVKCGSIEKREALPVASQILITITACRQSLLFTMAACSQPLLMMTAQR